MGVMKRFEQVGLRLMNRTRGSADVHQDPIASVLMDPYKRAAAAILMGQAFVVAHQGLTADYAVLCWWDQENELPVRVCVRAAGETSWGSSTSVEGR